MIQRHDYVGAPAGRFGTPVSSYPSPDARDVIIVEDIPLRSSDYTPLPKGTPRVGDTSALLVYEQVIAGNESELFVRRIYATVRADQDVHNFSLKYDEESVAHPIYQRSSIVRRNTPALAAGSALTSVYATILTAQGSGYLPSAPITVAFTGGGGSGAAATVILGPTGTIDGIVLTNGGTGYTSAPTIAITSTAGTGATGTAYVQSPSAILVHQETQSLEQENPQLHALFVRAIRIYATIPGPVLPGQKKAKPRRTPEKYIVSESTATTKQRVAAGTPASTPTGEGNSSTVTPVSTVESEKGDETLTLTTAPTTEFKMNEEGQVVTISGSVGADNTAPTITAFTELASVDALGDGVFEKRVGIVPEVFDRKEVSIEQSVKIPAKFMGAGISLSSESSTVEGTTATPDAVGTDGTGIIESSAVRLTKQKVRKKKTILTGSIDPNAVEYKMNGKGQLVTVAVSLTDAPVSGPITATTEILNSEAIGGGKHVNEVGTVDHLFRNQSYNASKLDPTPSRFKAAQSETTESHIEEGTAVVPTLGVGQFSKSEKQVTEQTKETSVTSRDITAPVTLTGSKITSNGQIATITETLVTGPQTLAPSATTIEGDVEALGNGQTIKKEVTVPEVFAEPEFEISIPNFIPQRFRALSPEVTQSSVIAGTAAMPTLAPGELSKSEQQLTQFIKKVRTTSLTSDPVPLVSTELSKQAYEALATTTETLVAAGTPADPGGINVLEAKSEAVSSTNNVKTTTTVDEWPTLTDTDVDQQTGISIQVVKTIVPAGTLGGYGVGSYTEVKALDKYRSIQLRSTILGALPTPTTWATTVQKSLPDVLEFASAVVYPTGNSVDCELIWSIKDGFSGTMAARTTRTFYLGPPSTVIAVTNFRTQSHRAVFVFSDGVNNVRVKSLTLPPTLHPGFALSSGGGAVGGTSSWSIQNNIVPPTFYTGYASGATFIHSVRVEEWRLGVWMEEVTTATIP